MGLDVVVGALLVDGAILVDGVVGEPLIKAAAIGLDNGAVVETVSSIMGDACISEMEVDGGVYLDAFDFLCCGVFM